MDFIGTTEVAEISTGAFQIVLCIKKLKISTVRSNLYGHENGMTRKNGAQDRAELQKRTKSDWRKVEEL